MQLLQQVESHNVANAQMDKIEVTMMGMGEAKKDVGMKSESDEQQQASAPATPQTYELKKNGYLALTKGLGSGIYDTGLSSQVSGGIEMFGLQPRDFVDNLGDGTRSFRQSSIDTEPHTLATICVRRAMAGAVEIVRTYDEEEALHLFLKDAEDDQLREEALAAILPVTAPELVT